MTYRQLGERLRQGEGDGAGRVESRLREEGKRLQVQRGDREEGKRQVQRGDREENGKRAAALRCIVGERSRLENAGLAPRNIDFDTCSYEDLEDYALPSERREM